MSLSARYSAAISADNPYNSGSALIVSTNAIEPASNSASVRPKKLLAIGFPFALLVLLTIHHRTINSSALIATARNRAGLIFRAEQAVKQPARMRSPAWKIGFPAKHARIRHKNARV